VTASKVFAFKWGEWVLHYHPFDTSLASADRSEREGEFRDVIFPVRPNLEESPKRDETAKNRMSVPPAPQVFRLWPGVRVQQIVLLDRPSGSERETPEINAVAVDEKKIVKRCHGAAAGQSRPALIDSDHEVVGIAKR
jgi:hypothetical protein